MARRLILSVLLMASAMGFAGCRMCGSPYDYCNPTFIAGEGRSCDPLYRAGSAFYGDGSHTIPENGVTVRSGQTSDPGCKNCNKPGTPRTTGTIPSGNQHPNPNGRGIGVPPTVPNGQNNTYDPDRYLQPIDEDDYKQPPRTVPSYPTPTPPPAFESPTNPSGLPSTRRNLNRADLSKEVVGELEELRRNDPTITDIRILNIEDDLDALVAPQSAVRGTFKTEPIRQRQR